MCDDCCVDVRIVVSRAVFNGRYVTAVISSFYDTAIVLMAVGLTGIVTFGLTVYALQVRTGSTVL